VFIPAYLYFAVSKPKYPQYCLVTLARFRGEKNNQSAADIRARHQYNSGLQSDTKGSLPFCFVLKKIVHYPVHNSPLEGSYLKQLNAVRTLSQHDSSTAADIT
jgi:hypothetical protein